MNRGGFGRARKEFVSDVGPTDPRPTVTIGVTIGGAPAAMTAEPSTLITVESWNGAGDQPTGSASNVTGVVSCITSLVSASRAHHAARQHRRGRHRA